MEEEKLKTSDHLYVYDRCARVIRDENRMHNIEKYDQSISADSLYCRLGETVMGRLVSIKRNVNWPGLVNRSQEDLSAVGCRLSSHTIQNKGS